MLRKTLYVILGCFIVCIGVILLQHSHLVTGGTTGIALGVSYFFNIPFSIALMVVSIPFYLLSIFSNGMEFYPLHLFCCPSAFFYVREWNINGFLTLTIIPEYVGAVLGGGLLGFGLSILFLNGSSLGGVNVLVLYLQDLWMGPWKSHFCGRFHCCFVWRLLHWCGERYIFNPIRRHTSRDY